MSPTHTFPEPNMGSPTAPGRTLFISALIAAASLALVIAEQRGFRIFDESLRGSSAANTAIPSPMEFLVLVGAISSGVVAGLVCALTSVGWIIHRLSRAPDATSGGGTASVEDECAVHNVSYHQ